LVANATAGHASAQKQLVAVEPSDVDRYIRRLIVNFSAALVVRDVVVLGTLFRSAKKAGLVTSNPCEGAELPKLPDFNPPILKPEEIRALTNAIEDRRARVLFTVLLLTAIRQHEARNLKWRDVDLIENRLKIIDSKSPSGRRSIAITSRLNEELWQWRRETAFQGDDEYVFAHPRTGGRVSAAWFKGELVAAMKRAGLERMTEVAYVDAAGHKRLAFRAWHDNRHTSITHDARSASPFKVKAKAGHSSLRTTERYVHLSGSTFPDEAEALDRRLYGELSTELSTNLSASQPSSHDHEARNQAENHARYVG
jgi:integrase